MLLLHLHHHFQPVDNAFMQSNLLSPLTGTYSATIFGLLGWNALLLLSLPAWMSECILSNSKVTRQIPTQKCLLFFIDIFPPTFSKIFYLHAYMCNTPSPISNEMTILMFLNSPINHTNWWLILFELNHFRLFHCVLIFIGLFGLRFYDLIDLVSVVELHWFYWQITNTQHFCMFITGFKISWYLCLYRTISTSALLSSSHLTLMEVMFDIDFDLMWIPVDWVWKKEQWLCEIDDWKFMAAAQDISFIHTINKSNFNW